ncbi:uncharacterized protein LOC109851591 isoform X2 [Asparagus officinalis]|nr:uncharacterized protein LOC109851591 isoform X2 [Asparagus officinalis]XP_020277400.1 uncharacterized protein LOC109851591 isoform X2 [Asparagus officinalis]
MEVEHLLKDDRRQLQSVVAEKGTEQCPSSELLLPKTSNLEGLSLCAGVEVDPEKLNDRLKDKGLQLKCESVSHSPKDVTVGGESSDGISHSKSCDDNFRPGKTSAGTDASVSCLNVKEPAQFESSETVTEPASDAVASISSISESHTSSDPDFSILKGELCLDNLTIRELQKVFRATFGRQTSVKDKLWLKRRITMGLTNSCEVPTTSIVIKDNKVVHVKGKEEPCSTQQVTSETGSLAHNQMSNPVNDRVGDSPSKPIDQMKDEQVLLGKRLRKPPPEHDMMDENIQIEHSANKRIRKPTKRYIEELSDVETRDSTGRLVSSVKDSERHQLSLKPQVKPLHDIGSRGKTFVTRKDSIGGCGIQIPYVSRMRRGKPRKDLYALTKFGGIESDRRDTETSYSEEEQDPDNEKINPASVTSSDNDADAVHADKGRTLKVGVKRKHHRAWTLSEVLRLVEGVARYGAGRWSVIRQVAFASYSYRTSVDLKDKWRNLIKASFAQYPSDQGAKNFRKPTSVPIPSSILMRVRELAELHSQSGIEFGPGKFAGHGREIVQEKGSGFL